jgi:hypothetical protein
MRARLLIFTFLASVLVFPPSLLAADRECGCCNDNACNMPCCNDESAAAAAALLPVPEVGRQTAVVWFKNPVLVGEFILMGKYIIEHDNERMAQGLPCTHIYAADKPQLPVVKFHCVHLKGAATDRDLVTLDRTGDPTLPAKLSSFQFAGETAAHGMPRVR